jgi:hypothetical protein
MRKPVAPCLEWTVETYKIDKRTKEGVRLVMKQDYEGQSYSDLERMYPRRPRYIIKIVETWVTRTNLMGGGEYRERYDTPRSCSPSSEAYWSM